MGQPLEGRTVVELGRGFYSAHCARLLGDFGADVIKVEAPGQGDPLRQEGPFPNDEPHPERSGLFLGLNTNKRGVTLDISRPTGRDLLLRLLESTDVLVESLGPRGAEGLGLGYEELEQRYPGLVMVSISPFGDDGPYRDFQATDLTIAAISGWAFQTGEANREPLRVSAPVADPYLPGYFAAIGALAALRWRDFTGEGQRVEVAAMEALHHGVRYYETTYAYLGRVVKRVGNGLMTVFPYLIRPCRDGHVPVVALTEFQWEMLAQLIGRPELLESPDYQTSIKRGERAGELTPMIDAWLAGRTRWEAFTQAQERRIPFGMVLDAGETLDLPAHQARAFFPEAEHPEAGRLRYPGHPFDLGEGAWRLRRVAPRLGEHNREVWCQRVGLPEAALAGLAKDGIV